MAQVVTKPSNLVKTKTEKLSTKKEEQRGICANKDQSWATKREICAPQPGVFFSPQQGVCPPLRLQAPHKVTSPGASHPGCAQTFFIV